MQDFVYFVLERPETGPCEEPGCSSIEADVLCDLCNIQVCPKHSYEWTYPNARGYDHEPQKIICGACVLSLRAIDDDLAQKGEADAEAGRIRRRDGIVWEELRY